MKVNKYKNYKHWLYCMLIAIAYIADNIIHIVTFGLIDTELRIKVLFSETLYNWSN